MIGTCKKLVTDLKRNANIEADIVTYADLLTAQYNHYATVKMSMNYFTMMEVCREQEDPNTDVCKYFGILTDLVRQYILERNPVDETAKKSIRQLRHNVEFKMHNLTSYTDGYEIYEYILNRVEGRVKNQILPVEPQGLSEKMFQYVFMENDPVVINSKLQLLLAQLPVRMTKAKFYDVLSNTLNIYEGGETTAIDEFCDMIRTAVLIKKPDGFETEYPFLKHVYNDLSRADYKQIDEKTFDDLSLRLGEAARLINNEASAYMLLQEVINDVYTILLTVDKSYDTNLEKMGYKSALEILKVCMDLEDLENLPERMMDAFRDLEGVQETVYESVMILESVFEELRTGKQSVIEVLNLTERFEDLSTVGKLLSTSLFVDLNREYGVAGTADHAYVTAKKDELLKDLDKLFAGVSRMVRRSMMSKLLSTMPVFMNTQQEIKDYFEYVLDNCGDDSELSACYKLVSEMIEEEA